ncbi:outer membrane beta-barrel protein [bacterium]|nr:outer membrane beta-barrel protein [bacterium]MBU1064919.1 outer membrane beta-barrel protein [bacterium]MBU1634163.1 outer membrane beta-barrel protein [bacterium]MBU1874250.1 outer membrane beta-barrel protein [bacterium]
MNKLLITFSIWLCCLIITPASQNNCRIKGYVLERDSSKPLENANVLFTNLRDSTVNFTFTDNSGWFHIDKLPQGKFQIEVTYIGYTKFKKTLHIESQGYDMGTIYLKPEAVPLQAVEIVVQIPMAIQNGDTLEYIASAIAMSQNASAKDLVLKMAGFYNYDGKIQIDGENIENVMVNGDDFFKYNPTMTLETIPAEMIGKIQVFDKRSEEAEMTGIDDGKTTKTINIVLKPDKSKGKFGKTHSAYGQNDVYQLDGNMNSFGKVSQFTVTAQLNNNLKLNLYGPDQYLNPELFHSGDGIAKTQSCGINFKSTPNKKIKINGDYIYNYTNSENKNTIYRQYLFDSEERQEYFKDDHSENLTGNHNIFTRIEYNISEKDKLYVNSRIFLNDSRQNSFSNSGTYSGNSQISSIENENTNDRTNMIFSEYMGYKHDFIKDKRSVAFSFMGFQNTRKNDNEQKIETVTPDDSTLADFKSHSQDDTQGFFGSVYFQEDLGNIGKLSISAKINRDTDKSSKYTYRYSDPLNSFSEFDSSLSGDSDNDLTTRLLQAMYEKTINRLTIQGQLKYENLIIRNRQSIPDDFDEKQSYFSCLPDLILEYKFNKSTALKVIYTIFNRAPRSNQLNEVLDNDDPEYLKIGNADLTQQYWHNINLNYKSRNTQKNRSFKARIKYSICDTYIGTRTIIAGSESITYYGIEITPGTQLTRPENMSGYNNVSSKVSYEFPIKYIKSNLFIAVDANYTQTPGYLNDTQFFTKRNSGGVRIILNSNISKDISFKISNYINVSSAQYDQALKDNTLQFNQRSSADLEWNFGPGLVIQSDLNYTNYNRVSSNLNNSSLLWNMSFGKKLFKNQQGDLRIYIYDILKENNNISQRYTETYIEERESLDLNRYLMLLFTYNIKHFSDKEIR